MFRRLVAGRSITPGMRRDLNRHSQPQPWSNSSHVFEALFAFRSALDSDSAQGDCDPCSSFYVARQGASQARSVECGTPSGGHARGTLWRPELNSDVLLSLDRPLVYKSGLVTPQANGAHSSRKKRERAAHAFYVQHLAELSDGGADLYGFRRCMSIPRPRITRPNEGDKLTGLQSSRFTSRCTSALRRDKNRKLGANRERTGSGDRFFRQNQPERFAAVAWASEKDCGGR